MMFHIETLEQSFAEVRPQLADFATTFYEILFSEYPALTPLFAHVHIGEQREKLISALVLMVDHLRRPAVLEDALRRLGTRHAHYGVLPAHYAIFWQVLLKTFQLTLDDQWTPETHQAWADAYANLTHFMLEGAADSIPTSTVTGETMLSYWTQEPELTLDG